LIFIMIVPPVCKFTATPHAQAGCVSINTYGDGQAFITKFFIKNQPCVLQWCQAPQKDTSPHWEWFVFVSERKKDPILHQAPLF
jgi:hypothetical protein